jgi:hypothetical protein
MAWAVLWNSTPHPGLAGGHHIGLKVVQEHHLGWADA